MNFPMTLIFYKNISKKFRFFTVHYDTVHPVCTVVHYTLYSQFINVEACEEATCKTEIVKTKNLE